jgi:uncharacterized phage-associated protein
MGVSSVPVANLRTMAPRSAQAIAAEIRRRLPGVPSKKLHKLLYYAQGHHAATFNEPLFSETISAWDMGPVVAQLWWLENQRNPALSVPKVGLDEAELNTIGYVLSRYGKLSGSELERLTHTEAPWIDADRERQRSGQQSERITVEVLAQYFRDQAAEDETSVPVDQSALEMWLKTSHTRQRADAADTPEGILARLR